MLARGVSGYSDSVEGLPDQVAEDPDSGRLTILPGLCRAPTHGDMLGFRTLHESCHRRWSMVSLASVECHPIQLLKRGFRKHYAWPEKIPTFRVSIPHPLNQRRFTKYRT